MSGLGEILFHGEYGQLTRVECSCEEQVYDVSLGDSGWERDPGIEHETREKAMDGIATAITELQEILALLAKEPK